MSPLPPNPITLAKLSAFQIIPCEKRAFGLECRRHINILTFKLNSKHQRWSNFNNYNYLGFVPCLRLKI